MLGFQPFLQGLSHFLLIFNYQDPQSMFFPRAGWIRPADIDHTLWM